MMLDTAPARADALFGHEVAYGLLALAAARGHAELELEFIERVHALCEDARILRSETDLHTQTIMVSCDS